MQLRVCAALFVLAALALAAATGRADDDSMNRASFAVESSREVENDQVTAVIGATHEDADAARLADRINTDVSWGVGVVRKHDGLRVRSGGYRTWPIEDPKRAELRRWRGSQDIVIESDDPKLLSGVLGELQSRLQLRNLSFGVSTKRRREVENELLDEALAAFRARADRVAKNLGASSWELVRVDVDASGAPPVPVRMGRTMAMAEAATPPALEAGTTRITARANGTIELR